MHRQAERALLRHALATIAYRTQKALRGAPPSFGDVDAGHRVRTPSELVRHMTSVLGYARTFVLGGQYRPEPLPDLAAEVERLHAILADLSRLLASDAPLLDTTEEHLLQGPIADALTHVGQLALLRRLAGAPVAPENFVVAAIDVDRLGPDQSEPRSPDEVWPEAPDAPPAHGTGGGTPAAPRPVRRATAPHDTWGAGCDAWHLLRDPHLSVIEERVPAGAGETRHRHRRAQQLFYVLAGVATMELEHEVHELAAGDALHVPAGAAHRLVNRGTDDLRFLVVSAPMARGDREGVPEDA